MTATVKKQRARQRGRAVDVAKICGVDQSTVCRWKSQPDFPPVDDAGTFELFAVLEWYFRRQFAAEEAEMLRSEGLLEPSDSPGLERYRQAKAAQEEIKLAELRSEVVMLGDFEEIAQAIFQPLRAFGEHLKRGNDPELLDRLNEANQNVLAGLDRLWNRNP